MPPSKVLSPFPPEEEEEEEEALWVWRVCI
jgi:hypothetical protein